MSGGKGAGRDEAVNLAGQVEAAMEMSRLISKVEGTLGSIERLGAHLSDDVGRRVYSPTERGLHARQTAHALQDAIRALTGRAQREVGRLKEEHATSRGLPDLPSGLEPNCVWEGGDDGD